MNTLAIIGNVVGSGQRKSASEILYVYDTFDDTAGTNLNAHTISPTNTPGNGWVLASGTIVCDGSGNADVTVAHIYYLEIGQTNLTIQSKCRSTHATFGGMGLAIRYLDANNYWWVMRRKSDNKIYIAEKVAGVNSYPASVALTESDITVALTLKIVDDGSSITASIVEYPADTVSYSSTNGNTRTKVGLVTALQNPESTLYEDFRVSQT